jgi:hypothetical protein
MVEADLPEACSLALSESYKDGPSVCPTTSDRSSKKRSSDALADVIKDTFNKEKKKELADCKIKFMTKEIERKTKEFDLLLEEKKLKQWNDLRDNIKNLRDELNSCGPMSTVEEIEELESDIKCLLEQKNECAILLGMDPTPTSSY